MADSTIITEARTEFGKGAARRVRRDGKIPAVLYGHGMDPAHLVLPGHQTALAVKMANAVLTLVIGGKEQLALVKEIQRNPIKPVIEHMDLIAVRKGEKVTVDIQVSLIGEAGPDTLVTVENQTLQVAAEATNIPESLEVSIEGLTAGSQIHASGVTLPAGVELLSDPELLVVNIVASVTEAALEADLAGETAEDAAAAGGDAEAAPAAAE